jgi:hypothetical protein
VNIPPFSLTMTIEVTINNNFDTFYVEDRILETECESIEDAVNQIAEVISLYDYRFGGSGETSIDLFYGGICAHIQIDVEDKYVEKILSDLSLALKPHLEEETPSVDTKTD